MRTQVLLAGIVLLMAGSMALAEDFSDPAVATYWQAYLDKTDWSAGGYYPVSGVANGAMYQTVPNNDPDALSIFGAWALTGESLGGTTGVDAQYDGDLLGDLTGRCLVTKFRLNTDMAPNTPFVPGDFYGENYDWAWAHSPEEIRVSMYFRASDGGDPQGNDEYHRWFNEPQGNRMFFEFGAGNSGMQNDVWVTMVTPLAGKNFTNYLGYGGGDGTNATGLTPEQLRAYFAETISSVDQFRLQIDSGYTGMGGFGFSDGANGSRTPHGTIEADALYTVSPGDGDLDGDVDGTDYVTLVRNFTGPGATGKFWTNGDFDSDGDVDGTDYVTLVRGFTGPRAAGMAPVPEPMTVALLLAGSSLLALRRRK